MPSEETASRQAVTERFLYARKTQSIPYTFGRLCHNAPRGWWWRDYPHFTGEHAETWKV